MSVTTSLTQGQAASSGASQISGKDHVALAIQLKLLISAASVGVYPSPPADITSDGLANQTMTPAAPSQNTNDICLISGPLHEFLAFSMRTKWLIDIAHDICDPVAQRGLLSVWDEAVQQYLPVMPDDPLIASSYRYTMPGGLVVGLSKISHRTSRSRTSTTGSGSTMANRVKRRDGRCWVSPVYGRAVTNSHIVPKRMGDHLARVIFNTFAPPPAPIPNLSIHDEIFGISLSDTLDAYFDNYELGLQSMSQNQYKCHVFAVASPGRVITIYGESDVQSTTLHGRVISPPQPTHPQNPPAGLFRWHYLQCVLRKFAHTDYKNQANIRYSELPIPMDGDLDDDSTDSDGESPSAASGGQVVEAERRCNEEHLRLMAERRRNEEHIHSMADWIVAM
ncbi:hypothetical protein B0H11DRAFT_2320075 [Mycena galericulata]|nr:hypothetical protein B0H11DRAFT_2320075 [Mycena galericulata]